MTRHPLAVISTSFGLPSESFIHRHMTDLLPGGTVAVVNRRTRGYQSPEAAFPCLVLEESKRHWRWLFRRGLYRLGLDAVNPRERMVEEHLRQHGVEAILSEYLDKSLEWLPLARRLGLRFYAHAHGYDVSRELRKPHMRRRYLELAGADGIITMSEASRRRLVELGLDESRIHVIPYGTDIPEAPRPRPTADGAVRCLAVGRMIGKKSPLLTLGAFQQALAAVSQLRLDFVGDGPLYDQARRFIDERKIGDRVTLHGSLPHDKVLDLMRRADIFVQHSRTDPETGDEEGLPVAILEAMANGLPVVSTRHAAIPEAVVENASGILVDEGDVAGMAEGIRRLALDAGLRERFGNAGWARTRERFSWERERNDLIELLGLQETPAPRPRESSV